MNPTHECRQCGTQYFAAGGCDWCPVQITPLAPTVKYVPTVLDVVKEGQIAILTGGTIDHPNLSNSGGMVMTSRVTRILKNGEFYTENTHYIPGERNGN